MKKANRFFLFFAMALWLSSCVSLKEHQRLEQRLVELEARQSEALQDTDGDGVLDFMDQEPDTPPGAIVDTKGRTLDSDLDGVPDYRDREPFYTPRPGENVDSDGVVVNPTGGGSLTEERARELIEEALVEFPASGAGPGLGTIVFDFIYFTPSSTEIQITELVKLRKAAIVMRYNPQMRFVVKGYTDPSGNQKESLLLRASYKRALAVADFLVNNYGIARGRLAVQYFGGSDPVAPGNNVKENRRVEIYTAAPDDFEMPPPD